MVVYSTGAGHRQGKNEMCLNAFTAQTQTSLHSPHPSNGLGIICRALKAGYLLEAELLLTNQPVYGKCCFTISPS